MTGAIHGQSIADNLYFKQREENSVMLPMFTAGVALTAEIDGSAQLAFLELGINDATAVVVFTLLVALSKFIGLCLELLIS